VEKFRFKVTLTRQVQEYAEPVVEAATPEEATRMVLDYAQRNGLSWHALRGAEPSAATVINCDVIPDIRVVVEVQKSGVTFYVAEEGLVLERDKALKFTNPHIAEASAAAIRNEPLNTGLVVSVVPVALA
jgi:hypothetical protein